MRHALIPILILCSVVANAQKYSKSVADNDILNFMTWLLLQDTAITKRHVDNDIIKLNKSNFKYNDTSKLNNFLGNIFVSSNNLDTVFNEKDADYFVEQIESQRRNKWNLKLKNIKLFDEVRLNKDNQLEYMLYSYSLPLFSVDKQKVIIIQRFYCGLVCGGGEYSLYEKFGDSWKKVKQFNVWAE